MDLERPLLLLLLIPVALLVAALLGAQAARRRRLARLAEAAAWPVLAPGVSFGRPALRAALLGAGLSCLVVAAARPRWGSEWQEFKRRGLDIVIALDTSRSMLAEDVKPNRLERAKLGVQDLLARLRGDRVGLVLFAGAAHLQCPLTVDYAAFQLNLDDARAGAIPRGGTDIRGALDTAVKAFDTSTGADKVVVLISDGEDHTPAPDDIAKTLRAAGVKLFCIGVGSSQGELIPVTDANGQAGYLKDPQDHVVKSALNEAFLGRIATASGGAYIKALATDFGIETLYEEVISKLNRVESNSRLVRRLRQQFPWFLGLALVFLAAEALLPSRKGVARP